MTQVNSPGRLMDHGRRALLDGALVGLPIGAIVLLVLGIVAKLQQAADPLSGRFAHPAIVAVAALVLLCLVIGFLIRSAAGQRAGNAPRARRDRGGPVSGARDGRVC